MIDFVKDVFDICHIKVYNIITIIESIIKGMIDFIHHSMVFLTFISMFGSLLFFMYYGFYSRQVLSVYEWFVYLISIPILLWVNSKL